MLLAVAITFLELLFPIFTEMVVDKVIVEKNIGLLKIILLGMGAALFFVQAAPWRRNICSPSPPFGWTRRFSIFSAGKCCRLPMTYFTSRRTGDIQRRLDGARQVRQFAVQHGIGAVLALVQLVGALALMVIYSPSLMFAFLATTPLYLGLMYFSQKVLRPLFAGRGGKPGQIQLASDRRDQGHRGGQGGRGRVGLSRHDVERIPLRLAQDVSEQFHRHDLRQRACKRIGMVSTAIFLWVGANQVMNGSLSIGGFVAFSSLTAMAYGGILRTLGVWDNLQFATVLLNRLNDVFEQEPEQGRDRSRLTPVHSLEGRIELRGVSFKYGGPEAPNILTDIKLDLAPGRMIAFVGRSGCGKTTLIKLIAGLLEPTEGTILFDNVDLKTLNYRDVRRHIGMVLQENHIFNESIARNIAFGDAGARSRPRPRRRASRRGARFHHAPADGIRDENR